MKHSGVRSTMTLHHTLDDIRNLVDSLARHVPAALERGGEAARGATRRSREPARRRCTLEHHRSAAALDATEWDGLLGERGTFTVDGLRFLERAFAGGERPEDEWNFHYYVVRDREGKAVLATFFTAALWKDDMMASAEVSELVEAAPRRGPVLPDVDDVRDGLAADRGRPPLPGPQRGLEGRAGPADGRRCPSTRRPPARGRSSCATCTPPTSSWPRPCASAATSRPRCRTRSSMSRSSAATRSGSQASAPRRACTSARPCCRSTTPTTSSS